MVGELLNEETANGQGQYRVCIFTNLSDVSYKDEKASIQDSKGSGGKEVQ